MKIILLALLTFITLKAQDNHSLHLIEQRLIEGHKEALSEIAPYFDNDSIMVENLGYHILHPKISSVTRRIFEENTIFTASEFVVDTTTTTKQLLAFLKRNKRKIVFSDLAAAFLITPIKDREVKAEFRDVSTIKMTQLKADKNKLFTPKWVSFSLADSLIEKRDPKALLIIASEFYKKRYRFDRYYSNTHEFTDLLQYLTGIVVGVENDNKEISWHSEKDFNPQSSFNLLIYFSKHYKDFKWDAKKQLFINKKIKVTSLNLEVQLIEQMKSKTDSVALNAFIKLTESKPTDIIALIREINATEYEINYSTPTFPDRFLKQLSYFTQYCRNNNLDYKGSATLKASINKLKEKLSFKERCQLENELIDTLTLDDITAFEYWCIIYEKDWELTYSAGKILDVFYSKQWKNIISNPKQLNHYLKKSALFERLGIIGICNDYLIKFKGAPQNVLQILSTYKSDDADIMSQVKMALKIQNRVYEKYPLSEIETSTYLVDDLERKLNSLFKNYKDSEHEMDTLTSLLSKISYNQIGIALTQLEKVSFKDSENVYSFLNRDFGFFLMGYDQGYAERKEFLQLYNNNSEFNLYSYYLNQAGIAYKTLDGKLDYDRIYNYIKYSESTAFVGGGGGTHDNGVYAVLKLLEITFKTTLGFSNKYCSSNNMYSCTSDIKVKAWMAFLEKEQLLHYIHDDPISFHTYKYSYKRWKSD